MICRLPRFIEQKVSIKNLANGKTATATVRDSCPGCGSNDIGTDHLLVHPCSIVSDLSISCADMSPSLFQELGDLDTGVLNVSWDFV